MRRTITAPQTVVPEQESEHAYIRHAYSLVELDYGGLVYLLSDDALCGDQSAAELSAALAGVARGECELAVAM